MSSIQALIKPQNPVINWGNPITQGLVLDVNFADRNSPSTGTINTVYRKLFTINNAPLSQKGIFGLEASFNGSSDYFTATNANSSYLNFGTGAFSLEAVIKPTSFANSEQNIIRKDPGGTETPRQLWLFRVAQTTGTLDFAYGNVSGSLVNFTSTTAVPLNKYSHVVAVRDKGASKARIYINGIEDKNVADISDSVSNLTNVAIGAYYDAGLGSPFINGNPYTGQIVYVRAWNRTLTSTEVKALYINPWQIYRQFNRIFAYPVAAVASVIQFITYRPPWRS